MNGIFDSFSSITSSVAKAYTKSKLPKCIAKKYYNKRLDKLYKIIVDFDEATTIDIAMIGEYIVKLYESGAKSYLHITSITYDSVYNVYAAIFQFNIRDETKEPNDTSGIATVSYNKSTKKADIVYRFIVDGKVMLSNVEQSVSSIDNRGYTIMYACVIPGDHENRYNLLKDAFFVNVQQDIYEYMLSIIDTAERIIV